MATIVIIPCVKEKATVACKAKNMYLSKHFKDILENAKQLFPDYIFILSGKYGLLDLNTIIDPYDINLELQSIDYQKNWNKKVKLQLENLFSLQKDKFIFFTPKSYHGSLIKHISNYEIAEKF